METMYTVKQVADICEVSEEQVRRWLRQDKMCGKKLSCKQGYLISKHNLEKFMYDNPKYNKENKNIVIDVDQLLLNELKLRVSDLTVKLQLVNDELNKLNKFLKEL